MRTVDVELVDELRDEIKVLNENAEKLRDLVEYAYREGRADSGTGFDSYETDSAWRQSNSRDELGRIR